MRVEGLLNDSTSLRSYRRTSTCDVSFQTEHRRLRL